MPFTHATRKKCTFGVLILLSIFLHQAILSACSTFKLERAPELIYGHNLNQGDIGVPGMIFINKRGVFKKGRTWSELINRDRSNPSSFFWISRYGSVTFNVFGRDLPDGGMNETGLYIWEMSEDADHPNNDDLPKLSEMNWVQFVLDSYSTVDEVIRSSSEVELDGLGWHFFVGDGRGHCAAISFVRGEVVVKRDQEMPVPALFNTPYDRELELLKYYHGFGGLYEPNLNDPKVPRFVKAAVMLRDFDPAQNAVDYGFQMLDNLKVNDLPEWSVLFDARRRDVYFKTRIHPEIKRFSMDQVDFTNRIGPMILNIDITKGGDVLDRFHPYTKEKFRAFTESLLVPILPEEFFYSGGLTLEEYLDHFSSHTDDAASADNQFFRGTWKSETENDGEGTIITLDLDADREAVSGEISFSQQADDGFEIEHLQLIGNRLTFTYRTKSGTLVEVRGIIDEERMELNFFGIEEDLGSDTLLRQN